jgi:hypothetical protein
MILLNIGRVGAARADGRELLLGVLDRGLHLLFGVF